MGGFSDAVFDVINQFLRNDGSSFVKEVEAMELPAPDVKPTVI